MRHRFLVLWKRLLSLLFRPKPGSQTIFYNTTLKFGERRATQRGGGRRGLQHTFGACDRCQSSANFSSFFCVSADDLPLPAHPSRFNCRSSPPPLPLFPLKVEEKDGLMTSRREQGQKTPPLTMLSETKKKNLA